MNRALLSTLPSMNSHTANLPRVVQIQDLLTFQETRDGISVGPQDLGGLPEHVEAELKPTSKATCVTSNRWGTMLAGTTRLEPMSDK